MRRARSAVVYFENAFAGDLSAEVQANLAIDSCWKRGIRNNWGGVAWRGIGEQIHLNRMHLKPLSEWLPAGRVRRE